MSQDPALLVHRAQRLADDLIMIAGQVPAAPVKDGVIMLYNDIRAGLSDLLDDATIGAVPRFGAGAGASHAELAIYAGQLAELAMCLVVEDDDED